MADSRVGVGRTAKDEGIFLVNLETSQQVTLSHDMAEQVANHITTCIVELRDGEKETFGPFSIKRYGEDFVFLRVGIETIWAILSYSAALKLSNNIRRSLAITQRHRVPELLGVR
jgi:hypothetical protein